MSEEDVKEDPDEEMSKIIPCLDIFAERQLIKACTEVAIRFMSPVYLCGSALKVEDPLDLDLFLVVSERQYEKLIGKVQDKAFEWQRGEMGPCYKRMARLYSKQKDYFESFVYHIDIDFKLVLSDTFYAGKGEKLRLDQLGWLF